jgi:hypothetical protein
MIIIIPTGANDFLCLPYGLLVRQNNAAPSAFIHGSVVSDEECATFGGTISNLLGVIEISGTVSNFFCVLYFQISP